MVKVAEKFDARKYMELAIEEMKKSRNEPRPDGKVPPKVGAVIVFPDGEVFKAHRGELREGDHGEYTLIERKLANINLEDCILFTTLEPCVERNSPKVPCCRRTTNARIKKVYVGIVDPDPTVSTKGIGHLERCNVEVKMFDRDLQKIIEEDNAEFLKQAIERKNKAEVEVYSNPIEETIQSLSIADFSTDALQKFIDNASLPYSVSQPEFYKYLIDLGVLSFNINSRQYHPNGYGILLFGKEPRLRFKNAALKCTAKIGDYEFTPESFDQALVLIPDLVEAWLRKVLSQQKDTGTFKREVVPDFPFDVLREAVLNAVVHRDYDVEGVFSSIYIDLDSIVVKSPGLPPASITLEQLNSFKAPSISKNPIITYVFNLMGYVEETGLGMSAFYSLNAKYKLPLPEYQYNEPFLSLTFARNLDVAKKVSHYKGSSELTNNQMQGFEWLRVVGEASTREYSNHFDIGYKTAQRHLAKLKELGLVDDNGSAINSPNFKYVFIGD